MQQHAPLGVRSPWPFIVASSRDRHSEANDAKKVVDPTTHDSGQTTPQKNGKESPKLPHERDESSDSQTSEPRKVIRQAHDDLARGLVDTDRGPLLDELYKKQVRPPGRASS